MSGSCLPKPGGAQKGEVSLDSSLQTIQPPLNSVLPPQIIDPYVQIYIHDPWLKEKDTIEARTDAVQDNGFNPVWNQVTTIDR